MPDDVRYRPQYVHTENKLLTVRFRVGLWVEVCREAVWARKMVNFANREDGFSGLIHDLAFPLKTTNKTQLQSQLYQPLWHIKTTVKTAESYRKKINITYMYIHIYTHICEHIRIRMHVLHFQATV